MKSCNEDMLRALRGEPCKHIPWAPRMDLWYIALRERGKLPPEIEHADIVGIAEHFGFGCHAVRADYPFRFELEDLPCHFALKDDDAAVTIETSTGELSVQIRYSSQMRNSGISQPFKLTYPVEERGDLDKAAEVLEHLRIIPEPEVYEKFHDRVGEAGLAVAHGTIAASQETGIGDR